MRNFSLVLYVFAATFAALTVVALLIESKKILYCLNYIHAGKTGDMAVPDLNLAVPGILAFLAVFLFGLGNVLLKDKR
jgi:hypothetical protein